MPRPNPTQPLNTMSTTLPDRAETMTQDTRIASDAPSGPITTEQALAAAHLFHAKDVLKALESDADEGLREAQVKQRSEEYGPNMLEGGDEISMWNIFVHQIANAMTLVSRPAQWVEKWRWHTADDVYAAQVLILAMAVSFGIESWIEGGVLAGVVGV